jgi:hypothetical protein
MGSHRIGSILRLVGDAARLEVSYGSHSLEALAWVARTVESSVYVPRSLVRTRTGFRIAFANPPLRIGGFSSLRVLVDGATVPPVAVRYRTGAAQPWQGVGSLGLAEPLELQAGSTLLLEVDHPLPPRSAPITVRLELQSVAIPPTVWVEVRDTAREADYA